MNWLKKLFGGNKNAVPAPTGRQIDFRDANRGWGWNFEMWQQIQDDPPRYSMFTFCSPRPVIGDDILIDMKSGMVGVCRVMKVKHENDPADMERVEVGIIGYLAK